ncbi:MAG: VCBS repeat-containing protein, partial [Candidatus Electrothrix sp. AR4]|nr:VCBS repeat-containing protein [Candidatus Electrothrix sp. AR4]
MKAIIYLCSFLLLTLLPSAAFGKAVIAVGVTRGQDHVYAQNESLNFKHTNLGDNQSNTSMIAVGDIDGDGDRDIVVTRRFAAMTLYKKNDTGGYAEGQRIDDALKNVEAIALGDIDGDGDLDLVPGKGGKPYLNDGGGIFTADNSLTNDIAQAVDLHLVDMDGDDHLDVVALVRNDDPKTRTIMEQDIVVYSNDGTGNFTLEYTDEAVAGEISYQRLTIGDGDSDGDPDIYAVRYIYDIPTSPGSYPHYQTRVIRLKNDGDFAFSKKSIVWYGNAETIESLALGDLDGDGDLDLLTGRESSKIAWAKNDGSGSFGKFDNTIVTHSIKDLTTTAMELGDVDGNGTTDIIVGLWIELQNIDVERWYESVLYGNGLGGISSREVLFNGRGKVSSIKLYHRFKVTIDAEGLPSHLMEYLKQGTNGFYPAANFVNGVAEPRIFEADAPEITAPGIIEDKLNNCYYQLRAWYGTGSVPAGATPDDPYSEGELQKIPISADSAITWVYEKVVRLEVATYPEAASKECAGDGITTADCVAAAECSDSTVYGMACTVESGTHFYPENTSIVLTTIKDITVYTEELSCGGLNPLSGNKPIGAPEIIGAGTDARMASRVFLTQNTKLLWNYSDAQPVEVGTLVSPPPVPDGCDS